MRHSFSFRPNLPDELHCVPCSVGMLLEGLTGDFRTDRELEEICGFEPGKEVWQFQWMLTLANEGHSLLSVDEFDPELFISDPEAELLRGTGDPEIVERVFEVSDVPAQIPLVEACLAHPRIDMQRRIPTFDELSDAVGASNAALVNVNARILNGREGYAGHVVLLHRDDAGRLTIQDPGPPAQRDLQVVKSSFLDAWHSPSVEMANYVCVSTT